MAKRKVLIYDIAITGHHSEYIGHLVDYLHNQKALKTEYHFVLNPLFSVEFPNIYEKAREIQNVVCEQISGSDFNRVKSLGKFRSSLQSYKVLNEYANTNKIDHVCVLDYHSIKYSLIFFKTNYTISSILFLLFHRLEKDTWKQKVEFYKRYYLTKIGVKNKSLRRVFVLNDQNAVRYLNTEFKSDIFKMLPDPIPELMPLQDFNIYNEYDIDKSRKIFLHIGALGNRKGTSEVIESARHLNLSLQKRTTLLLVGQASDRNEEKIFDESIKISQKNTGVQIIWHKQFVSKPIMKSLFDQCDVVLLPYKNAEYSSGILGHAAAARKLVIATGEGLIKELVTKHQLGELLEKPDAENIAIKISEILNKDPTWEGQMDFVKSHSPKIFAKMILNT